MSALSPAITFPHPETLNEVVLTGHRLTIPEAVAVARHRARVRLSDEARERVARCRLVVETLVEAEATVYGLTTGFGSKRDVPIGLEDTEQLQLNLIRSHACGVGDPLPEDVVRAAMLLRANTLAGGNSGIRPEVIEALLELLNRDVYPLIPEQGSVGASGDLAPLSHLVLVLVGDPDGRIYERERSYVEDIGERLGSHVARPERFRFRRSTPERLAQLGITPVRLLSKEGLALNNGTQLMTAIGLLNAYDGERLEQSAEAACALSLEAAKGVRFAFDPRIHLARGHEGQVTSAARIRALTEGSEILTFALNTARVQGAQRALDEAAAALDTRAERVALDDEVRATRLEMLASHAARVRDRVLALSRAPLDERDRAKSGGEGDSARLTGAERDAEAFRAALVPLKREASLLYRELLSASALLPEEDMAKPRALIGVAIHALEEAVPSIPRVQDDYSLRCAPQVLGTVRRALEHAARVVSIEMNAATDNPLIFPPEAPPDSQDLASYGQFLRENLSLCKEGVVSGGNFHGEPVGMVMDYLTIALAEVASISERRVALVVDGARSNGLPSLLVSRSGLNSGLMIPQYTAAALVSENKVLAHPAVVDSIPTGESVEDHVSMGTIAARKCRSVLRNAERVVAIELLTAHQGLQFRLPFRPAPAGQAIRALLTEAGVVPFDEDRVLYPLINRALNTVRDESVARLSERFTR